MEDAEKQQGQRHGPLALVFPMIQRLSRQARQEGTDDLASVAGYLVEPSILVAFLSLTPFLRSSSLQSLPSQVILASLATSQVCSFFPLSSMVSLPSAALTTVP